MVKPAGIESLGQVPRIPASAGALIFDRTGRLLILKPNYKPGWTIPGGQIEETGESPWQACQRETLEECGLELKKGRLVCVDFLWPRPGRPGGVRFLFDCGVFRAKAVAAPENIPFHRVFFEVVGLAAHQGGRFDAFLKVIGSNWRVLVAASLRRDGVPAPAADTLARELVALWRGLQLDLITSGDRAGTAEANADAAVSLAQRAAAAAERAGGVRGGE